MIEYRGPPEEFEIARYKKHARIKWNITPELIRTLLKGTPYQDKTEFIIFQIILHELRPTEGDAIQAQAQSFEIIEVYKHREETQGIEGSKENSNDGGREGSNNPGSGNSNTKAEITRNRFREKLEQLRQSGALPEDDLGELKEEIESLKCVSDEYIIAVSYTHLTLPTKRIV